MMLSPPRKIALSMIASKVCDLILSPKTSLPALMNAAGAPAYMSSLLVPIRESGSLLPQMLFSYLLRNQEKRHYAWRLGAIIQLLSIILMLIAAFSVENVLAGLAILICLGMLSLARALCSLTNKDIQGKHIQKGERGKLIGSAGTISSLISVVVAVLAWIYDARTSNIDDSTLILLAFAAVSVQSISLLLMWPVKTTVQINNKADDRSPIKNIVKMDKTLKKFIVVRSLLSHSALIAPLFTLSYSGRTADILAFLIIAQASASMLSSYIWGKLADKSALFCMRIGAIIAGFCGILLILVTVFAADLLAQVYLVVLLFFFLGIGHQGIRTGRKIYSVDIASEHQRTAFVAKSNSIVGSFILVMGITYSIISVNSTLASIVIMTIALITGAILSFYLKHEK